MSSDSTPQTTGSSPSFSDDMAQYLQVYIDESDEEIEGLVEAILQLEGNPRHAESLHKAFRMLHSLKGSSGMLGFEAVGNFAHELEDRFERYRSGAATLDRETTTLILQCVDYFRAFLGRLRSGDLTEGDPIPLLDRLRDLERGGAAVIGAAATEPGPATSPGGTVTGAAASGGAPRPETMTISGGLRIEVRFRPGLQLADLKARLIVSRLSSIGEIIACEPAIDDAHSFDDLPLFSLTLITDRGIDEVRRIAKVDGVQSIEVVGGGPTGGGGAPAVGSTPASSAPSAASTPSGSAQPASSQSHTPQPHAAREAPSATMVDSAVSAGETTDTQTPADSPPQPAHRATLSAPPANATSANTPASNAPAPIASMPPSPPSPPGAPPTSASPGPEPEPSDARTQASDTLRVDIGRLDHLMNLTGELVVANARFAQITGEMSPLFRQSSVSKKSKELTERLRQRFEVLKSALGDAPGFQEAWANAAQGLDDDLEGLDRQSESWAEGHRQFNRIGEAVDQLTRVSKNLQRGVLNTRMVPVGPLFNRFKRVIRDLSVERKKQVHLVIQGEKTELDKRMIDALGDPLLHLVRNSIDHGLEPPDVRRAAGKPERGTITLEAAHRGNSVWITVRDDGAGINTERIRARIVERGLATAAQAQEMTDPQAIGYIWHPGFSTAEAVTEISGRGVGMDIVRNAISELSGTIDVASTPGAGTTFTVRLPLTLAIIHSLMMRFREDHFSIPIDDVREIVSIPRDEVHRVHRHVTIDVRGELIPLVSMTGLFQWSAASRVPPPAPARPADSATEPGGAALEPGGAALEPGGAAGGHVNVVVIHARGKTLGLQVDSLVGRSDLVIKSLTENFQPVRGLSGASILGDGAVCLMLDSAALIELASERSSATTAIPATAS